MAAKAANTTVWWEYSAVVALADQAGKDSRAVTGALRAAHTEVAKQLQGAILKALVDKIDARGRRQRATGYLVKAIASKKFIEATVEGFSLGGLDSNTNVAPYYHNLDVGTSRFMGRVLRGSWIGETGKFVPAEEDGFDARFRRLGQNSKGKWRGYTIIIKHPIPAYDYFQKGIEEFRSTYQGQMLALYAKHFEAAGMNFALRWVAAHPGAIGETVAAAGKPTIELTEET